MNIFFGRLVAHLLDTLIEKGHSHDPGEFLVQHCRVVRQHPACAEAIEYDRSGIALQLKIDKVVRDVRSVVVGDWLLAARDLCAAVAGYVDGYELEAGRVQGHAEDH